MYRRVVVGGLALVAVLCAWLPHAGAGQKKDLVGIRLVDPQSTDEGKRGAIVATAARGETLKRTVAVANSTDERMLIKLYAGAARFHIDQFEFGEPGETNAASSWTKVKPKRLDLAPNTEKKAKVTIRIPKGAAGGTHAAVVWAELPSADGGAVTVVNRVGVRIYLEVDGTAGSGLSGTIFWIIIGIVGAGLVAGIILLLASRRPRGEPPLGPERMRPEAPPPPPLPEPYRPPSYRR